MPRDAPLLLYDGECGFCRGWSRRLARWDRAGRIRQLPYQQRDQASGLPPIDDAALDRALHVVLPDGQVRSGARGVIALLPWLPGGRTVGVLARMPGLAWAADRIYAAVARRRHARGKARDSCAVR